MMTPREAEAQEGRITVAITRKKGPTLIFSSENIEDVEHEVMKYVSNEFPELEMLKRLKKQ